MLPLVTLDVVKVTCTAYTKTEIAKIHAKQALCAATSSFIPDFNWMNCVKIRMPSPQSSVANLPTSVTAFNGMMLSALSSLLSGLTYSH